MAETMAGPLVRPIAIVRHPIYSMLLPVPVVCFIGALLADITYLESGGNLIWLSFASWFLFFGLLFGALAALILLIDLFRSPGLRRGTGLAHLLLFYLALFVELWNILVHERDGWTAVMGLGLTLSIVGVVLILIAGWLRRPAMEVVA
ncbi:MAG TPA: DUF2231 domain-containing protein [Sphingomicrobium sp.]